MKKKKSLITRTHPGRLNPDPTGSDFEKKNNNNNKKGEKILNSIWTENIFIGFLNFFFF